MGLRYQRVNLGMAQMLDQVKSRKKAIAAIRNSAQVLKSIGTSHLQPEISTLLDKSLIEIDPKSDKPLLMQDLKPFAPSTTKIQS